MADDNELREQFRERKRRQWRVMWFGLPGVLAWMALSAVTFYFVVASRPSWNNPWLMAALMAPGFILFGVFASRFTQRNLRCPACDAAIAVRTGYNRRGFECPTCRRSIG